MFNRRLIPFFWLLFLFSPSLTAVEILSSSEIKARKSANYLTENVILTVWKETLKQHISEDDKTRLLNAPISGKTDKRGRHLLSFSAFNGMKDLAKWGLKHGARINVGDKDNATLLRMAAANYLTGWVLFALQNGADPNLASGDGQNTLLDFMVEWKWPVRGFTYAIGFGAKAQDEEDLENILTYMNTALPEHRTVEMLSKELEKRAFIQTPQTSATIELIDKEMIHTMDLSLHNAILNGKLSPNHIHHYYLGGKTFLELLAYNGFNITLQHVLSHIFSSEEARAAIIKRDSAGNDLLIAGIKSLNKEMVDVLLDMSTASVNTLVPTKEGYTSSGDGPLHIAIKWKVSADIIQRLLESGAALGLQNATGQTPLQIARSWGASPEVIDLLKK